MVRPSTVPYRYAASVLALLIVFIMTAGWDDLVAGGRAYPEAKMQIVTEGLTADEQLQRQADLSNRLNAERPVHAVDNAIRVSFTPEEIDAIDQGSRSSVPLKIGLVKPLSPGIEVAGLSTDRSGARASRGAIQMADPSGDGGFVWSLMVSSLDAGGIRLHVEDMSLPEGAELYLYSRDGQAHGPYAGEGPNGTGEFWTATIFGPEAIIQVKLAAGSGEASLRAVSLRVQEIGLITRNFVEGLRPPHSVPAAPPPPGWPCGNANCLVDATCVGSSPANSLKLAVAKMEWTQGAYIYTCTGGLIADNNPTQDNFFLTANHCISKNNSAQNVNFYWRFATSSCNATSCPDNSGWPYQTSGSTVSKSGRKGDFTLLHLNSNPPAGSVVLGWNSAPVANTNGANLYRVSNPNFGTQVYSEHNVDSGVGTCAGWPRGERIYSRDIVGAIDGGSSGSPIANASGQIVGQLSGTCGTNPSQVCSSGPGEANATVDGAFAFYFSLVQPFLNP